LYAAGLAGLRVVLNVGKGRPYDKQGVALFEGLLRRLGTQQTDAANRERMLVGDYGLAEQRLDDRRAQQLRGGQQLFTGSKRAAPG
jgi:hypothetical protein